MIPIEDIDTDFVMAENGTFSLNKKKQRKKSYRKDKNNVVNMRYALEMYKRGVLVTF